MSKRSYYRRYKRTYPKQRWQTTVVNTDVDWTQRAFPNNSFNAKHTIICQSPVPQNAAAGGVVSSNNIVKTGNFKVKGTFSFAETGSGHLITALIYVIFVPQGIIPDSVDGSLDNLATSAFYAHPEWVLGWTRVNLNSQGTDTFSISSRLKRNLNSGDSIQLGVMLINQYGSSLTSAARFKTTIQYAARAN